MKLFIFFALVASLHSQDKIYQLGKKLYDASCVSCHGVDGQAKTGMRFVVNPKNLRKSILTHEQRKIMIKNGGLNNGSASDMMPSFSSVFGDNEIEAVAQYITDAFSPQSEKKVKDLYAKSKPISEVKKLKMMKRGEKIYNKNCSYCHGLTGNGDGEATRNPEMTIFPHKLSVTQMSEEQMFLYVKHGGKFWGAQKDDMPAWGGKYDDFAIKSVVEYIFRNIKK